MSTFAAEVDLDAARIRELVCRVNVRVDLRTIWPIVYMACSAWSGHPRAVEQNADKKGAGCKSRSFYVDVLCV